MSHANVELRKRGAASGQAEKAQLNLMMPSVVIEEAGASTAMERPLSPFMFPTWYRFQITSVLSILHRLTGIALAIGSILLAWWLVAVAAGGDVFAATLPA